MEYYGIGFSNIRIPSDPNSYVYRYDTRANTFPEEVFLHEFLHTLERNLLDRKYEIAELHDYEKYGYKEEKLNGLRKWYQVYMENEVKDASR